MPQICINGEFGGNPSLQNQLFIAQLNTIKVRLNRFYFLMINRTNCQLSTVTIFIAFLIVSQVHNIVLEACLEYQNSLCIRCSPQTVIFQHACYKKITGCLSYNQLGSCTQCDQAGVLQEGKCLSMSSSNAPEQLQDEYKVTDFIFVAHETVRHWETFVVVDERVRNSEYGKYIKNISNPIISVQFLYNHTDIKYRILYEGAPEGLFLILVDISSEMKMTFRETTRVNMAQVVEHCVDYSTDSIACVRCQEGMHLEEGKCYYNYGGCKKYRKNICLECIGLYLLIENRCVSDCQSLSDTRSILFFNGDSKSTMERIFGGSPFSHQFYNQTAYFGEYLNDSAKAASLSNQQQQITHNKVNSKNSKSIIATLPPKQTAMGFSSNLSSNTRIDPNCAQYSSSGKECLICSKFYFKNEAGICSPVSPLCKTYSQINGNCETCFENYILKDGHCQINAN